MRNYNKYDYISVSVKRDQFEIILSCYMALGWREAVSGDDFDDGDRKFVTLYRPHRIANKDRLQYLQVRMETQINYFSHIASTRHRKSGALSLLFTLLALCFAASAVCLWVIIGGTVPVIFAAVLLCLAAVSLASVIYPVFFMRKAEDAAAYRDMKDTYDRISALVVEAKATAKSEGGKG